jgi:UrcA family protein
MNCKSTIAAAALALSAPAFAAHGIDDAAATVKYGDLDLASPRGIAHLERRVHRAAEQVCGYVPSRGLREQASVADCQEDFEARAGAQLQPVLAAAGRGDVRLAQSVSR